MTEWATPSSAEEQLAAIASLSSALDQHGVEYWLFGGWAVDFWVGAFPSARRHRYCGVAPGLRHDPGGAGGCGVAAHTGRR